MSAPFSRNPFAKPIPTIPNPSSWLRWSLRRCGAWKIFTLAPSTDQLCKSLEVDGPKIGWSVLKKPQKYLKVTTRRAFWNFASQASNIGSFEWDNCSVVASRHSRIGMVSRMNGAVMAHGPSLPKHIPGRQGIHTNRWKTSPCAMISLTFWRLHLQENWLQVVNSTTTTTTTTPTATTTTTTTTTVINRSSTVPWRPSAYWGARTCTCQQLLWRTCPPNGGCKRPGVGRVLGWKRRLSQPTRRPKQRNRWRSTNEPWKLGEMVCLTKNLDFHERFPMPYLIPRNFHKDNRAFLWSNVPMAPLMHLSLETIFWIHTWYGFPWPCFHSHRSDAWNDSFQGHCGHQSKPVWVSSGFSSTKLAKSASISPAWLKAKRMVPATGGKGARLSLEHLLGMLGFQSSFCRHSADIFGFQGFWNSFCRHSADILGFQGFWNSFCRHSAEILGFQGFWSSFCRHSADILACCEVHCCPFEPTWPEESFTLCLIFYCLI